MMIKKTKANLFLASLLFLSITFLFISSVSAVAIDFVSPTPANGSTVNTRNVTINATITSENPLSSIIYNWNGTNYTIFDNSSLIFYYNFDNRSSLGENSTYVQDLTGKYPISMDGSNPGASVCSTGHYGGGACFAGTPTGQTEMDMTPVGTTRQNITNGISNRSITAWVKPTNRADSARAIMRFTAQNSSYIQWFLVEGTGELKMVDSSNISSYKGRNCYGPIVSNNEWTHVAVAFEFNQSYKLYINGEECEDYGTNYDAGDVEWNTYYNAFSGNFVDLDIGEGYDFNGTMDDVSLWNKTLSSEEIEKIYSLGVTKFNDTSYVVYGQKNNERVNSSILFKICANDSIGNIGCTTEYNYILQYIHTITSLYDVVVGYVRSNFYGVGLQGTSHMFSGSKDTNCDGISETVRNYAWNKQAFLDGGNKITYYDVGFDGYYNGIENPSFEWWINNSDQINISGSGTDTIVRGWAMASAKRLSFNKSTDAHSGSYALNITGGTGTNDNYIVSYFENAEDLGMLENGTTYFANIWAKGDATVTIRLQESGGSFAGGNSSVKTVNSSEGWKAWNVSFTTTTASTFDYRFVIDGINITDSFLIDDFSMTRNGSAYRWWRTGNTTNYRNQIQWGMDNNITQTLILNYMPEFLAKRDSNCVDSGSDADYGDCTSDDNTTFGEISVDFYKRVDNYQNTTNLEIWNEPYLGFFQDNIADYSAKPDFVQLYNNTYNTIKAYNPNIRIVGYRDSSLDFFGQTLTAFTTMMLSNLTNVFDEGFSFHPYESSYLTTDNISSALNELYTTFNSYGINNEYILLDEWQPTSATLKNASNGQSDRYKANLAYFYHDVLNSYPSNVSLMYYHWADSNSYFNCPSRYSEYPSFWSGVSEAGLDDTDPVYYPPYNITKDFSKYAPAGWAVYDGFEDEFMKMTSTRNGTTDNIIITNKDNEPITINLSISNINSSLLMDVETGDLYDLSSGSTNLGIMDAYDVKYLSTPTLILTEGSGLTKKNYLNETIETGSNDINISSKESQANQTLYHIASSINGTASLVLTGVDCERLEGITYTPNGGASSSPSYTCTSSTLNIANVQINPSATSNELLLSYGGIDACDPLARTGFNMIMLFFALALIGVCIFLVYRGWQDGELTMYQILVAFIALIVGIIMWQLAGQNLGAC